MDALTQLPPIVIAFVAMAVTAFSIAKPLEKVVAYWLEGARDKREAKQLERGSPLLSVALGGESSPKLAAAIDKIAQLLTNVRDEDLRDVQETCAAIRREMEENKEVGDKVVELLNSVLRDLVVIKDRGEREPTGSHRFRDR